MPKVTIEISAHHCHLSRKDLDLLFGKNYQLKWLKALSQIGQYAAKETISIKTVAGRIDNIRILGPARKNSQVELTKTDCYKLKITPPIVECTCGQLYQDCAIIEIIGPKNKIKRCAAMIAHRHIHCDPKTAKKLGLKDNQLVSVKTSGLRSVTFHKVLVRVAKDFVFRFHLDTDEANAAGVKPGDSGIII